MSLLVALLALVPPVVALLTSLLLLLMVTHRPVARHGSPYPFYLQGNSGNTTILVTGGIVSVRIWIRFLTSCLVKVPFLVSVGLAGVVSRIERRTRMGRCLWVQPRWVGRRSATPASQADLQAAWLRRTCVVIRNQYRYSLVMVEEVTMVSVSALHMIDHQFVSETQVQWKWRNAKNHVV